MTDKKLPLIIAHRGASGDAPENTFAAFRKAIETGADGIEFDVRLTKDNVPVVFHDHSLQRIAKRKERVLNLTSAELQTVDVGAWFNHLYPSKADAKFVGQTILTLEEFFDFLGDYRGRLYVELKGTSRETPALVETVLETIKQTNFLPNVILKSFDLSAVSLAKKSLPEICTAALFAPKLKSILSKKNRLIELAREINADELSIHYSLATTKLVAEAARQNMPVAIWTANRASWAKRSADSGINAIITNYPARLLAARAVISNRE